MPIVIFPKIEDRCPNCKKKRAGNPEEGRRSSYKAMRCPNLNCGADFCGGCFSEMPEGHPEDDGNHIRCPNCQTILEFPK